MSEYVRRIRQTDRVYAPRLAQFDIELTERCNNDCIHCCINLPANDMEAKRRELNTEQVRDILGQAAELGYLQVRITGGEPLLRDDFPEIYLNLKRKGLMVSVFTNATLIREDHIKLFKKYPPRDIEVTVYGVTRETYERITGCQGSFSAFREGLNLLLWGGVKVRLKAMALRSNLSELPAIARFCRERTKDFFRCDPLLNLRYDGDERRNIRIRAERLSPDDIVAIERADEKRFHVLRRECEGLVMHPILPADCNHLFHCGLGLNSFTVGWNGIFRLCMDLWHSKCVFDLRNGTLAEAWREFSPRVRDLRSDRKEFLETCHVCPLFDLCYWCPAHAHLETGALDAGVEYFCRVAHARARALKSDHRLQPVDKKTHL